MAASEQEAINIGPPIASAGTDGLGGVFSQATSTSAARYEIPSAWRGRYVTFFAKTEELQIAFGDSTVSVNTDENSSVASEAITFDVNTGWPIPAGQEKTWRIPKHQSVTHFSVRAAGDGRIFAHASQNYLPDGVV